MICASLNLSSGSQGNGLIIGTQGHRHTDCAAGQVGDEGFSASATSREEGLAPHVMNVSHVRPRSRRGGEFLGKKLLNVLHLPVGNANLLNRVPVRVLHEHVRRRTLCVRHLHVWIVLQLALSKLLDGRVVPDASAAHVEHGARVHNARVIRLLLAAAGALGHQRVTLTNELTQLGARRAEQARTETERAAFSLVSFVRCCKLRTAQ
mmetsp:Transcript_17026/g.34494  ORF Transcript_17026/g.34494 Transcript_17026/m.34494 type:complete len:207 (-) Transcript_17026:89-709(-)